MTAFGACQSRTSYGREASAKAYRDPYHARITRGRTAMFNIHWLVFQPFRVDLRTLLYLG